MIIPILAKEAFNFSFLTSPATQDVIVADRDGAVVIPAAMVDDVASLAVEQERLEGWIMTEIDRDVPLPGLYPANEETKARYEKWKKMKDELEP